MYYVFVKGQFKNLSIYLSVFNMSKLTAATNMNIMFFTSHFFNVISVNIKYSHFKFSLSILTIIRETTACQILYTYISLKILP